MDYVARLIATLAAAVGISEALAALVLFGGIAAICFGIGLACLHVGFIPADYDRQPDPVDDTHRKGRPL